ncbi:DNA directed RNA polymeras-like protein III subunit Rpc82 [Sporormia fimetaria CBS 119925]|uniref:DNA-directed RNA polymerase III subunit RPC3 n=1 Tax=Sporormia fimetaria CBS 119925 TaxID=1340428 RepID=A0A6A6V7S8_9PLEO|nr:DNA directed RNA polymeras-like protein III subunit Rpc82 [Sporormia fimetaria CBS 119925]
MSYAQRETPILAELCELLVEDVYGELAARVFSVLARHGRQTLSALNKASYLNSRQIKHGLVVLIQQHLVFHSAAVEPEPASYEIDWQQSYALIRYGRCLKQVEERYGAQAANVMSNLITLGHTRVKDLREAYFPTRPRDGDESDDEGINSSKKSAANGSLFVNGHAETNGVAPAKVNGVKRSHPDEEEEEAHPEEEKVIGSVAELDSVIYNLMLQGWIMKVEWNQYLGPTDLHAMAGSEAMGAQPPEGTKAKQLLELGILSRKREIRNEWTTVPKPRTRKRTAADGDISRSNKRQRIGGSDWAPRGDEVIVLDDNLAIRVNPEKVTVALRTDTLVRIVRQLIGSVPAKVYETMLRQIETHTSRCYDEWADPTPVDPSVESNQEIESGELVSAREVAKNIDPNIDLFEGLDPHAIILLTSSYSSSTSSEVDAKGVIDPPINPFTLDLEAKTRIVDRHIQRLADHPFHFATWHSRAGYSQWHIRWQDLIPSLIQHEIETTVSAGNASYQKFGVKLLRALKKKGKLDERSMGIVLMMPANEIRSVVNGLTVRGFVQTQEIPRVERREAKHSLHLIWFDTQRAREKLLQETYKGMVRALQRLQFEREKVKVLLEKAERSDVVGQEERWLGKGELEALRLWKGVERKLLLQVMRMDEVVGVLRDFCGPLVTP